MSKQGGTMTEEEYDEIIRAQEKMISELEQRTKEMKDEQIKRTSKVSEKLELAFNLSTSITMAFVAIALILIVIKIL